MPGVATHPPESPEPSRAVSEARFVAELEGTCRDNIDHLAWVAKSTFRVGEWALGVRSASAAADRALRAVLAAHLVDLDAPANFSVVLTDRHESGAPRPLNFLYRSSAPVVRTRRPDRVLNALLAHLSGFAAPPAARHDAGLLRIDGAAFVAGGRAIVAPAMLREALEPIESGLNRAGVQVVDEPFLLIDPQAARLVVPEPHVQLDADARTRFERQFAATGREPAPLGPGRYPLLAWAFVTGPEMIGRLPAAQGIGAALRQVVNAGDLGAQASLDAMVRRVRGDRAGRALVEPAARAGPLAGRSRTGSRRAVTEGTDDLVGESAADIDVAEIEGSFVPRPRPEVASAEIEGQMVLACVEAHSGGLSSYTLNATGSVLWQCFDGSGSLDEIARDVADVFDADLEVARADVYRLAREVGGAGLLVGVRALPTVDVVTPEGVAVGTRLAPFSVGEEGGGQIERDAVFTRRSVAINWSPRCGYCEQIVGELRDLAPLLAECDVDLAFLATGGADANRRLFDDHGFAPGLRRVYLVDRALDAFGGVGTPAAYLVERGGEVVESLAVGASQVAALARRVATAGSVGPSAADPAT